jgi:hypothetical protein
VDGEGDKDTFSTGRKYKKAKSEVYIQKNAIVQ